MNIDLNFFKFKDYKYLNIFEKIVNNKNLWFKLLDKNLSNHLE